MLQERSGKGIGPSFDQVAITTKKCGPLILRRGVTADNKDAIAARLDSDRDRRIVVPDREVLVRLREEVIALGFSEDL